MKLIVTLLLIGSNSVLAFEELNVDYNDDLTYIPEYQSQARLLNVSFEGIFNNSLLTLAGIFIVGVLMFGENQQYIWAGQNSVHFLQLF